jgi:hypothetical protein
MLTNPRSRENDSQVLISRVTGQVVVADFKCLDIVRRRCKPTGVSKPCLSEAKAQRQYPNFPVRSVYITAHFPHPFASDASPSRSPNEALTMTAPGTPSEPNLSIHRALMEVKHALATINAILPRSSDLGVNFALIETQTSLKEAIESLSIAEQLSKTK